MAREIKFRLWHEGSKTMVYLPDMSICDEYSHLCFNAVDEEYRGIGRLPGNDWMNDISLYEVQQYTGLKDGQGKEIYEGDILKAEDGWVGEVEWHRENMVYGLYCCGGGLFTGRMETLEVLGNIYENLELLR